MASFKQLTRGNWKVQVSLGYKDGKKQIVKKQGFKTKKEAEIWANELLNQSHKGYATPTNNTIIFKDFVMKWYEDHKKMSIAITTQASYIGRINTHLLPFFGDYKLNQITNGLVQDFYNKLLNDGMKPSSAKKVMDILISCFKYAKKSKLIIEIPTDIEKIKSEKPKIEYWNKDEISFFLHRINNTYLYMPVLIALLTGLRIGELCGLRWCDVDFEKGYVNVVGQVIYDRIKKELLYTPILKTDTSNRYISIPPTLLTHLSALKIDDKPNRNDFIIKDRDGSICNPRNLSMNFTKTVAHYKKSIDDIEESSGTAPIDYMKLPQITFHGLRHTHATLLILDGENIKVLQKRLGHKDITTTLETYTHVMAEMEQNTSNILENMFTDLVP